MAELFVFLWCLARLGVGVSQRELGLEEGIALGVLAGLAPALMRNSCAARKPTRRSRSGSRSLGFF
jgi:hypothetical protein